MVICNVLESPSTMWAHSYCVRLFDICRHQKRLIGQIPKTASLPWLCKYLIDKSFLVPVAIKESDTIDVYILGYSVSSSWRHAEDRSENTYWQVHTEDQQHLYLWCYRIWAVSFGQKKHCSTLWVLSQHISSVRGVLVLALRIYSP